MAKNFNTKAKDATQTKKNALIKQKMVSASSKDALKMTLDGIQVSMAGFTVVQNQL